MAAEHANIHVVDSKEAWDAKLAESILHNKIVVVDFTATWCGPCRLIAPIFEALANKHRNLIFVKVDVDEFQEIASEWEVRAMPTFLFIKEGKLVDKLVGANHVELERKVEAFATDTHSEEQSHSHVHHDHREHHVTHIEA